MSSSLLKQLAAAGRQLGQGLLQLVYPGCCHLCGQPVALAKHVFCDSCLGGLLTDPLPSCPHCAGSVGPYALTAGGCSQCRPEKFPFDAALRLSLYQEEGPMQQLILRLKYASSEMLAELIGEMWAELARSRFEALGLDAVVPVPLHWRRLWQRGYNQSLAIARGLAGCLRLPCQPSWLRRIRHTPSQTSQTATGRRDNVRGAFAVPKGKRLENMAILLVDDVITTGSTVREAAAPLKRAGAARVVVAVLARPR